MQNNINSELLDFKNSFIEIDSDLGVPRNLNDLQRTRLKWKCGENEQYSRREYIKICGVLFPGNPILIDRE